MGRSLRQFFLRDGVFKLAAFLLALIIWYGAGNTQSVEYSVKVPLEVRNLPEDLILMGEPPSTVRVRLAGRGRFLKFRFDDLTAVVDASECQAGMFMRPITPADVMVPAGIDAEVTEVLEPRMFRAELRAKARRSVRVEPVLAGNPPDGFTVVGSPRVSPEEVEIVGPADVIASIHSLRLLDLDLSKMRGMVVTKRRVDLSSFARVECAPSDVEVIVTVEPIAEARFPAVPVRVDTGRRGMRTTVAPSTVSVLVSGPSSVVSILSGDDLVLSIEGSDAAPGSYSYRTDIVGVNRVALLPVAEPSTAGSPGDEAPHRAATLALPPQVQVVEIVPSYFSLVIERGAPRGRTAS